MVEITYYHIGRHFEKTREFDDPFKARQFYLNTKYTGYYIVSYTCNTEYEMKVMEGIIKE